MSRTYRFTFKRRLPKIWKQAQDAAEMAVEEAMQEVCHDERPCGVCVKISRSEPGLRWSRKTGQVAKVYFTI